MKKIQLSTGLSSIIDGDDFQRVNQFKWTARTGSGGVYAFRSYGPRIDRKYQYLHRFILNIENSSIHVDHINGNTLDNRKENLRTATRQENLRNRNHKVIAKSDYRGVYFKNDRKRSKPWTSRIRIGPGKNKNLGSFYTAEDAAKAFDKAAKQIYGEFCGKLNLEQK